MNNQKIAQELIAVARELVGKDPVYGFMESSDFKRALRAVSRIRLEGHMETDSRRLEVTILDDVPARDRKMLDSILRNNGGFLK